MQRRKALATAGAITITAIAASIALGANLGLFGLTTDRGGPGDFAPVGAETRAPSVRTEVVDVPAPSAAATSDNVPDALRTHHDEAHETHTRHADEDD